MVYCDRNELVVILTPQMKIDLEKSISLKKLIYKKSFLDMFCYYFLVFVMPLLLFYIIFISNNTLNYKQIIFYVIVGLPSIWNIISLKYIDELTYLGEIETKSRTEYVNQIILNCKYESKVEQEDLVILKKSYGWFTQPKELIIIFDDKRAYGNLTNLGRGDIRIPFFSYFNKLKLSTQKNYC